MNYFARTFLIFSAVFGYNALSASHHHNSDHHGDNPPCNHESLEDARQAEHHSH